jgi:hypothetical protein
MARGTVPGACLAALLAGGAAAQDGPRVGQTREEFERAVVRATERPGSRMGFYTHPCPLDPPLVADSETYIARVFSDDADADVTLVAVKDGRVVAWRELKLPGFDNWFTHMGHRCRGGTLAVGDPGRPSYRYAWDGSRFTLRFKRSR